MKKNISILTASRAEYGLLKPIIKKLYLIEEVDVRIVVTGMHLSPEFGLTYKEIEHDGFKIDKKIDILLSSGSTVAVSKSMGLAMIGFAEYFAELKPDLLIVLGDRYETLAACCAATNERIPIAHLHGGEATEGLIDEAFRHSITKMSYLHFTSTDEYKKRVIQLGEDPKRVFNVGAIGIEVINNLNYLSKRELEKSLDFNINKKLVLLTFHPVTLEDNTAEEQLTAILEALDMIEDIQIIITKANSDMGGNVINRIIDNYVEQRKERCVAFESLGQLRYLSAIKHSEFVIGNSSSGIIEVPSLKKPTINIGDRQKGRVQCESVINCEPIQTEIVRSIKIALSNEFKNNLENIQNPYGYGDTSDKIIKEILEYLNSKPASIKKKFYNL